MLAFTALPVVLLMSVLTTLLFYWGILPPIVRGFAFALNRTMGVGGAVGLSAAANIFVGHVEAPLFIRPYLARLSRSELFVVMTGGMAGIAGTVLVLYAQFLRDVIPDSAGHLVIVIINLPLIGIWIRLLRIPYRLLYLAIIAFCAIGVYAFRGNPNDVLLAAMFGVVGYFFIMYGCEPAPLLLGFVLGPRLEESLISAMLMGGGSPMIFVNRPISLGLFVAALALLLLILLPSFRKTREEVL